MGQHRLIYGDEIIPYSICRISGRKEKIAIHINPDGTVQVDAPQEASMNDIYTALSNRARWVYDHLVRIKEQNYYVLPRHYVSGESHFYLGKQFPLKIYQVKKKLPDVKLIRGRLQIRTLKKEPQIIRPLLMDWYRAKAGILFHRRLADITSTMPWQQNNLPPIRLMEMKKQWGSCSPKGTILLNPQLVKAPRECVDYVICHELCHLQEHNHSKRFYRLMDKIMPEWQAVKGKLDGMAGLILNV